MSQREPETTADREWLLKMAEAEDRCESISVGGLASQLGMLCSRGDQEPPLVFSRLIEWTLDARGLSVQELAEKGKVDLTIREGDESTFPTCQMVVQLARALNFDAEKLLELSGVVPIRDASLSRAAAQFTAESGTSGEKREAYEQLVRALDLPPDKP